MKKTIALIFISLFLQSCEPGSTAGDESSTAMIGSGSTGSGPDGDSSTTTQSQWTMDSSGTDSSSGENDEGSGGQGDSEWHETVCNHSVLYWGTVGLKQGWPDGVGEKAICGITYKEIMLDTTDDFSAKRWDRLVRNMIAAELSIAKFPEFKEGSFMIDSELRDIQSVLAELALYMEKSCVEKQIAISEDYDKALREFNQAGLYYDGGSQAAHAVCEEEVVTCKSNAECTLDTFCSKPLGDSTCDPEFAGECALRPELCSGAWNPVCGCNDKIYANGCKASAVGQGIQHQGVCE